MFLVEFGLIAMGVVDTLMVGHVGEAALAAACLGGTTTWLVMITAIGLLGALDPLTSQAFGAEELGITNSSIVGPNLVRAMLKAERLKNNFGASLGELADRGFPRLGARLGALAGALAPASPAPASAAHWVSWADRKSVV